MADWEDWIEYIKNEVTLHDVLDHYNIERNAPGAEITQYKCPFHSMGGDAKPSARVYEEGSGYCWGCGKPYDSISFVRQYEGLGFAETLRYMEKTFGLNPFQIQVQEKKEVTPPAKMMEQVFESETKADPTNYLESINRLLITNRDELDLNYYLKMCILLDRLEFDHGKKSISDQDMINILSQVKGKIIQRVHYASNNDS